MLYTVVYSDTFCDDGIPEVVARDYFSTEAEAWKYMTTTYETYDDVEMIISDEDIDDVIPF